MTAQRTIEPGIYTRPNSNILWITYGHRGNTMRESSRSTKLRDARTLLAKRRMEIAAGTFNPHEPKLQLGDLVAQHLAACQDKLKPTSLNAYRSYLQIVTEHLGAKCPVIDIRPMVIEQFKDRMLATLTVRGRPYTRDSVNNMIRILRATLGWAEQMELIQRAPRLAGVNKLHVREGFLEPEAFYGTLLPAFDPDMADAVEFLYVTGRREDEMISLQWSQVGEHEVRWGALKNGDRLTLPVVAAMEDILARRRARRVISDAIIPQVFHRNGTGLKWTFRDWWVKVAATAGMAELTPHDLRRSALRNLIRSGVSETVAMSISGHRERGVFARYNITSDEDKATALTQMQAYSDRRRQHGPNYRTITAQEAGSAIAK